MKFKGAMSLILVLCMLFSVHCISVFANSTEDTTEPVNAVSLFSTWNDFGGEDFSSQNNKDFTLSVKLEKGVYQFFIKENDTSLSHPTTVKDTTATINSAGLLLSDATDARCTLLATGGNYTFKYNTDSDLLCIVKDGAGIPADKGENLLIFANDENATANTGDTVIYNIYLKTTEPFEDIQAVLNFDESKLVLTNTDAGKCCPLLEDVYLNTNLNGLVAVNSGKLDGYDFSDEKLLLSLEFTTKGAGEAYLDFIIQDMTVLGGEKSYYFLSTKEADGTYIRAELKVISPVVPTVPATSAAPIVTEATEAKTDATETPNTTNPATSPTTSSFDQVTTVSTDPSETVTTTPDLQYEMGDVNRDGKLNIKDATLIQKHLAKLEAFDDEQTLLADYLSDGKVNIKDATHIQKKLANLL